MFTHHNDTLQTQQGKARNNNCELQFAVSVPFCCSHGCLATVSPLLHRQEMQSLFLSFSHSQTNYKSDICLAAATRAAREDKRSPDCTAKNTGGKCLLSVSLRSVFRPKTGAQKDHPLANARLAAQKSPRPSGKNAKVPLT